jgi:hypothetical protein
MFSMSEHVRPSEGSIDRHESFNLHEQFLAAQIGLKVQQVARLKKRDVKDTANGIQMFRATDIDLEDRLELRRTSQGRAHTFGAVEQRPQVGQRFQRLPIRHSDVLALMPDDTGGS